MGEIFIGSDALKQRTLTRHQLRTYYRAIYPDVYIRRSVEPTLLDKTVAAWLWSEKRATIAGLAAAAVHGSRWIDDREPVELIWRNCNPPSGLLVHNERVADDEIEDADGLPVTTPARTAFDLARRLPRNQAVARLDALMYATPFSVEDVLMLAKRYRGARGLRRLRATLPLVDGGAASPQETRLRLLFVDNGFPLPTTQIPVVDEHGSLVRMLDMGWEDFMVAAEYDGDQHRTSRWQYAKDMRVHRKLAAIGWDVIRVIAEDPDEDVLDRAWKALRRRGFRDT
ncbi:MAG: hypothetical protein ACM4D3_04190 [Candidatus Sericytochromatia bacterium]